MNFILRTMIPFENKVKWSQHNRILGSDYSLIFREEDYESFSEMYQKTFDSMHVADMDTESNDLSKNTYGFLIYKDGNNTMPLYKNQQNYIMTENGNTFSNISYK